MLNRRTGSYWMGRGHTRIKLDDGLQNRIERRIRMFYNSATSLRKWRENQEKEKENK